MSITQRQAVLGLFGLLASGALVITFIFIFQRRPQLELFFGSGAFIVYTGLLVAYWRGWEPARYIAIITTSILISIDVIVGDPTRVFGPVLLLPAVMSLILAGPRWVAVSSGVPFIVSLVRVIIQETDTKPTTILIMMLIGGMVISRIVTDTAMRNVIEHANLAKDALAKSEQQTRELALRTEALERNNEEQRRLLELVAILETPAIALAEGVLLAPIVGSLDSKRAHTLMSRLLREVKDRQVRMVVIDIAGVAVVDTEVAQSLLRTAQALRLLGCAVTLTGISASVAATMTHLGVSLGDLLIARTPQEAMENYRSNRQVSSLAINKVQTKT